MNGLETFQVFQGPGSSSMTNVDTSAHNATIAARPHNGRTKERTRERHVGTTATCTSALHVLDGEAERVLLGLRGVEGHAVEQRLGLVVAPAVLGAELLHRRLV